METEVKLVDYKTREAWLAGRMQSIGASESAALFGLAPDGRESRFSLWAKKTGLAPVEEIDAEWLEWGQILEQPISERYAKRSGAVLWTPPSPFCVAVHPRLPFLTATIDRWIIESKGRQGRGDLEIKNVGFFNSDWRGEGGAVDVPLYVQAQVQHQLAVTGFSWAVVAALVGGNKMQTFEVERNEKFIAELEASAEEFWARVQRKEAPEVDGSEATARTLKALHPDDNGQTVELPEEAEQLWLRLEDARERKSLAEKHEKAAKNMLQALIGSATFGVLSDGRTISYKTQERDGYTVDACKFRVMKLEKPKATKGTK